MASRHEKEERVEDAARYAAEEIRAAREQRQLRIRQDKDATVNHEDQQQRSGSGIFSAIAEAPSSLVRAVGETLEHAKEAIVGRSRDDDDEDGNGMAVDEDRDSERQEEEDKGAAEKAKEKADEYKNYTTEKAREAKEKTKGKAGEAEDMTAEKTGEAKETAASGKLSELKDSAAEAARKAMGLLTGKEEAEETKEAEAMKEKAKDKAAETAGAGKVSRL
ncbi:hypothetical protein Dimus_007057 [Dionaea muscipula]